MANPKLALQRMTALTRAWSTLRPNSTFSGLTLEQFKAIVQPSFDTRAELAELDGRRQAVQVRRDDADTVSLDTVQRCVNAIKGDPKEGENGELYATLGYVRKQARANGHSRRSTNGQAQTPAAVKASEPVNAPEEVKTQNGAA